MILKIRRYTGNREWWIIDNIRRINYGVEEVGQKDIRACADIFIDDYYQSLSTHSMDEKTRIISAACRMEDGNEISVEFDTIAYLCNDKGQTIEKIDAKNNEGIAIGGISNE